MQCFGGFLQVSWPEGVPIGLFQPGGASSLTLNGENFGHILRATFHEGAYVSKFVGIFHQPRE